MSPRASSGPQAATAPAHPLGLTPTQGKRMAGPTAHPHAAAARLARRAPGPALRALALATVLGGTATAAAASGVLSPPPEKFIVSPGGVDMRSGRYAFSQTDVAVGGEAGLSFTRTLNQQVAGHPNPFGDFSHNFDIMVLEKRINLQQQNYTATPGAPDFQIEIAYAGRSQTFRSWGPANYDYDLVSRAGYGMLTWTPAGSDKADANVVYTYKAGDGTTLVFRPMGSADCAGPSRCAYVSTLTRADGTVLSFEYDNTNSAGHTHLRSVTNSRGYALVLEYSGDYVSKACVFNLTVGTKPANNLCPGGVPTAAYAYDTNAGDARLASAIDPTNATWGFVNTPTSMGFVKPGYSTPWLTNQIWRRSNDDGYVEDIITAQSFADGQSYTYAYDESPVVEGHFSSIAGGTYTDARGKITRVTYGFPRLPSTGPGSSCPTYTCPPAQVSGDPSQSGGGVVFQVTPGPVSVTDPLNRTTTFDYCDPNAMQQSGDCWVAPAAISSVDPGGIKTVFTWDFSTRTLTGTRQVARVVAGQPALPDIVRTAGYNCQPATIRYCEKPVIVTDALQHSTTYTYSPDHGGVLTETSPAVNGVQAQKRYTYAQRSPWTWTGSSYQPGPPIWVLTQMAFCKAGNPGAAGGCANGPSDEVVTAYDYGPDSGPNTLDLRGIVVDPGGLNLRTCYSYDLLGNKKTETKPRAGLTSCP